MSISPKWLPVGKKFTLILPRIPQPALGAASRPASGEFPPGHSTPEQWQIKLVPGISFTNTSQADEKGVAALTVTP